MLPDADRVPVWPPGVVGSISHKRDLCVVAVAPAQGRRGLGLDIEPDQPARSGLERIVCRDDERRWVDAEGPEAAGRRCRVVFSAKEAVYKACFPELRERWSFQDVGVRIDLEAERFVARLPGPAPTSSLEGRILRRHDWILCGVERR